MIKKHINIIYNIEIKGTTANCNTTNCPNSKVI